MRGAVAAALMLVVASIAGCTIATSVGPTAGETDAGMRRDGSVARSDASRDGGGRRADGSIVLDDGSAQPDRPIEVVDAGTDAGGDRDSGARPPCVDTYGSASDFDLCAETATTCEFFTTREIAESCDSTCARYGGACLEAYRELDDGCSHLAETVCGALYGDEICVCTR